jgi:hypothetical protein
MLRFAIIVVGLLSLVSCDSPQAVVVLEAKGSGAKVQLEPIAQLVANRTTHVAVDPLGNLYWSQESDDGQDLLFVTGRGGSLPEPAMLSSKHILAALRPLRDEDIATSGKLKAGGNIQSLVAGSDGAIYFYFNGGFGGPSSAQCLGRFDPRTREIQIVADTQQLANKSGMGRSLDLARGQLIVCGRIIRLFLRHTDDWAILEFEPNRLPTYGQGQLSRTIRRIRATDAREELDLTSPRIDLGPGPTTDAATSRTGLLVIDRAFGALYVADDVGNASLIGSLVGISEALSDPTIEPARKSPDAPERIMIFAADGPKIDPSIALRPPPAANMLLQYPAVMTIDPSTGDFSAISKDEIHAPGAFAIYATKLQQLIPIGRDTYAGYDASSGQLMRVTVSR